MCLQSQLLPPLVTNLHVKEHSGKVSWCTQSQVFFSGAVGGEYWARS